MLQKLTHPGGDLIDSPCTQLVLTQRLHRWDLAPEKGEPGVELPLLLDAAVGQVEEDDVLTVDVADEVVVEDVVVGVAGKLPDAHLAHGAQGALVHRDPLRVLLVHGVRGAPADGGAHFRGLL